MNLRDLDLNLLWALDALISERSVTRAAAKVGITQPAMSMALRRLRRALGDDLLVRAGGEYYPTPFAVHLIGPVQDAIRVLEDALTRKSSFDPQTSQRAFVLAASDFALLFVIRPVLELISHTAPGITLQVRQLTRTSVQDLEHAEVDLLFRPPETGPSLPSRALLHDRWVCALWREHPEIGETLSMDQYLSSPHVVHGRGLTQVTGVAELSFASLDKTRQVQLTTESFLSVPFLLRGTRLVALIHESLGRRFEREADIKLMDPPFETPPIVEAMYWHPRSARDPAHTWLRSQLVAGVVTHPAVNINGAYASHVAH